MPEEQDNVSWSDKATDDDNPEIKNMTEGEFRIWTKTKFDAIHSKVDGMESDIKRIDKRLWAVLGSVILSILLILLRIYLGA